MVIVWAFHLILWWHGVQQNCGAGVREEANQPYIQKRVAGSGAKEKIRTRSYRMDNRPTSLPAFPQESQEAKQEPIT